MQIRMASLSDEKVMIDIKIEIHQVKHGKQSSGLIDFIGSNPKRLLNLCENMTSS